MIQKGEILRTILPFHIPFGFFLRIATKPHLLALPPKLLIVTSLRKIRLRRRSYRFLILRRQLNREPLVVTPCGAFEFVDSTEAVGGDGVELAGDTVAGARHVEEERDLVRTADKRVFLESGVSAFENCITCSH